MSFLMYAWSPLIEFATPRQCKTNDSKQLRFNAGQVQAVVLIHDPIVIFISVSDLEHILAHTQFKHRGEKIGIAWAQYSYL